MKNIIIIAVLITTALLSACNRSKVESSNIKITDTASNKENNMYTEETEGFIKDFKNLDFESMYARTNDQLEYFADLYKPDEKFNKYLFEVMASNLEYEILSTEEIESGVNVYVHVSNIDMQKFLPKLSKEYITKLKEEGNGADADKILKDIMDELLSDASLERTDTKTVFNFIQQDDKWCIESNVGIYDDLSGGYLQQFFNTNVVGNAFAEADKLSK